MSAEIINLRRARKERARAGQAAMAEQSRILHGLSKQEKQLLKRERARKEAALDGHLRDRDPNS